MSTPIIISTWSFGQRGNEAAWLALARGGSALEAVEKVCQVVELDPEVDSVGFGGLPDQGGRVTLDGCIMLGPGLGQSGSVCCVRRFLHPVSLARKVMEETNHMMLAGEGADSFAEQQGFIPADLISAEARLAWEKWNRAHEVVDQSRDRFRFPLRPMDRATPSGRGSGRLFLHNDEDAGSNEPAPRKGEDKWKHHDTIGVLAIDSRGVIAGACSTSGTPFKLPGRVGDSPIIGHGLYVDPAVGAAVATGSGELIMGVCGSFLIVELMRRGATPPEAIRQTLQRIIDVNARVRPEHQAAFIALKPGGGFASGALRDGFKVSVRNAAGSEVLDPDDVMISG